MKRFLLPACAVLAAGILFSAFRGDDDLFELRKNFEIFGAVYEEIAVLYVDEVRPQPFMRAGIDAMLSELDPYTRFYDEADVVDSRLIQQKQLGSVGLVMGFRGENLTILAPENNASAYRQGVRVGDIVLKIGKTESDELTTEEAYGLLLGEPGSTVEVTIQRFSEPAPLVFVLLRVSRKVSNVSFSAYLGPDSTDGIAYVRLNRFGNRSGREVMRAFRNMNRDVPLQGMVLDLRNNPGGLLSEAIAIVELFVPKGSVVVSTRTRSDDTIQEFKTAKDPLFPDVPLVVLVNQFSASASEIVAGALQDYDRAVIMGETTFGKGLVQVTKELPHNTALKITVSHYFLPTGRTIQSATLNTASARVAVPTLLEFETPAGRTVRGGLGVEPDLELNAPELTAFEVALLEKSAFFLFADQWILDHCAPRAPNGPGAPDALCGGDDDLMIAEFEKWVFEADLQLETRSDHVLDQFEQEVDLAGYSLETQIATLRTALEHAADAQFVTHRGALLSHIEAEVRSHLLIERDRHVAEVAVDEWILSARSTVEDSRKMRTVLKQ